LLVTSAVHMPRSMACFRAPGWEVTPYPADFSRGPEAFHFGLVDNLADLDEAVHEWAGLVFYGSQLHSGAVSCAERSALRDGVC